MIDLSCHCGQVRLATTKRPDYIHECNCSLCSKTGARWAYFHPSEVSVDGATARYRRDDKEEPSAEVQFCANCGTTTHFTRTQSAVAKHGNSMMGVNMRLANETDLAGIELRYPDGQGWSGEGEFGYVRQARILDEDC